MRREGGQDQGGREGGTLTGLIDGWSDQESAQVVDSDVKEFDQWFRRDLLQLLYRVDQLFLLHLCP